MSTLAQMRTRIATDLARDDLTSDITAAINRAIVHYEKEPFWFKETTGTLATVAGTASYGTADGLPSDIKRIHYAEITVSGSDYEMTEKDIGWIQRGNPNATTGNPTHFAHWQNKLWLYLIPNAIYTVTLYYTKSYAALAADADTNDWTTYAEDLIESRALAWLWARRLRNAEKAAMSNAAELDSLDALRSKNEDYSSQQIIEPTRF